MDGWMNGSWGTPFLLKGYVDFYFYFFCFYFWSHLFPKGGISLFSRHCLRSLICRYSQFKAIYIESIEFIHIFYLLLETTLAVSCWSLTLVLKSPLHVRHLSTACGFSNVPFASRSSIHSDYTAKGIIATLAQHINDVHDKKREHKCPECKKGFALVLTTSAASGLLVSRHRVRRATRSGKRKRCIRSPQAGRQCLYRCLASEKLSACLSTLGTRATLYLHSGHSFSFFFCDGHY
ncbi:hypothetical protein F4810DRAFT_120093 [Camillea tinctor]|nr:hypothetical protein F4810DRAFT_120093 [Camillea tinctor]